MTNKSKPVKVTSTFKKRKEIWLHLNHYHLILSITTKEALKTLQL